MNRAQHQIASNSNNQRPNNSTRRSQYMARWLEKARDTVQNDVEVAAVRTTVVDIVVEDHVVLHENKMEQNF